MGDWVRYKLDRQVDHVLVDEAQDTNAAQWEIIERLVEEYLQRLEREPRSAAAPCSWSATSSRRSTASRAPIRERFREAREMFRRARPRERGDDCSTVSAGARVPRPVDRRQLPLRPAGPRRRRRGDRRRSATQALALARAAASRTARIIAIAPGRSSCGSRSRSRMPDDEGEEGEERWVEPARPALCRRARRADRATGRRGAGAGLDRAAADAGRHPGAGAQPRRACLADRRAAVRRRRARRRASTGCTCTSRWRCRTCSPRSASRSSRNDDLSLACLLVSPLIGWDQEQLRDARLSAARARCGASCAQRAARASFGGA